MGYERKKPPEDAEPSTPYWMLTFCDLTNQLLCFFVILFSLSSVDPKKFSDVMGSIAAEFGSGGSMPRTDPATPEQIVAMLLKSPPTRMQERGVTIEGPMGYNMTVRTIRTGVVLAVGGKPLFDPGSAEIREEGTDLLRQLARLTSTYRNRMRIVGHCTGDEIDKIVDREKHPDLWALSWARADNVRRFLTNRDEVGDPRYRIRAPRLEVSGAANYQPAVSNLGEKQESVDGGETIESGKAYNRRVELVVTEELVPYDVLLGE